MDHLSQLVEDIRTRSNDLAELEYLKYRSEYAVNFLSNCVSEIDAPELDELLVNITALYQLVCREVRHAVQPRLAIYEVCTKRLNSTAPGRPKYSIDPETLINLREIGYTWNEISTMLLVSRWTIQRRVKEFGLEGVVSYSDISDSDLDNVIREAKLHYGSNAGRSMVDGYLKSIGLRVQRRRIMKSLVRIDPSSSQMRWAVLIKRRKYSVPGPNSLWHADGHHSLVNWGFVIHGAIDGFSRLIVYLKCATNNKAETVLENFSLACTTFGCPSRLRTDKGGENRMLWTEMERMRGTNRGSFIAGSSVHNQRIERLWRDVWTYVACEYYYVFQALEAEGALSTGNGKHMFALHYVFKPRINHTIEYFVSSWNKHPLRTEKNWSPEKIWTNGMLDIRNRGISQVAELQNVDTCEDFTWYGYDPYAPCPSEIETSDIELFDYESPFTDEEIDTLRSIDPMKQSPNLGIDIYLDLLQRLNIST